MYTIKIGPTSSEDSTGYTPDVYDDIYNITIIEDESISVTASYWNASNDKEIAIEATDMDIYLTDYVDVDVNLSTSSEDVVVSINNAKRGIVETGEGDDTIDISVYSNGTNWSNAFEVTSGAGNDTIIFTETDGSEATEVNIEAGEGNDFISIAALQAGDAERVVDGGAGDDIIIGSEGDDSLYGGTGDDIITAGDGGDYIRGGAGDDIIYTGSGDDLIYGDHGDDYIDAGAGNDTIDAGEGDDTIFAGDGYDQVDFDSDDSYVSGGEGFDTLVIVGEADVTNTTGFEAIIVNMRTDTIESLTVELADDLIILLGLDDDDSVTVMDDGEVVTFIYLDDWRDLRDERPTIGEDEMTLFYKQGYYDTYFYNYVDAYLASTGEIVWSDTDLTVA